jgi:membrane protease YdiL (CAAX protease family)
MSGRTIDAPSSASRSAWTWLGLLVALGGPTLAVAAKHAGYFGSQLIGGDIWNWFALWGLALVTMLILVAGERQLLSAIGFRRFGWGSVGFGVGLGIVVIMMFPLAAAILKALNIPNAQPALAQVLTLPLWLRVGTLLTAGFTEEILFRGYPISRLKAATGSTAIATSIPFVLFVILHLPSWGAAHLLFVSLAALAFTGAFLWRGDLWANIIAHLVVDSVPLLILPFTGVPHA